MTKRAPLAAAAAAAAVAMVAAGCGGGDGSDASGPLEWAGTPKVVRPATLARDRVAVGRVRNRSDRTVRLSAARVRIRDAGGRALRASAGFTTSYAHGLFGAFPRTRDLPPAELVRLGRVVTLAPGASAPFFAAWRLLPQSSQPVCVDFGAGTLEIR